MALCSCGAFSLSNLNVALHVLMILTLSFMHASYRSRQMHMQPRATTARPLRGAPRRGWRAAARRRAGRGDGARLRAHAGLSDEASRSGVVSLYQTVATMSAVVADVDRIICELPFTERQARITEREVYTWNVVELCKVTLSTGEIGWGETVLSVRVLLSIIAVAPRCSSLV